MKGQQIIDYIQDNNLQDSDVIVTATIYKDGDHDCVSTGDISLMTSSKYDPVTEFNLSVLDIYVDDKLY